MTDSAIPVVQDPDSYARFCTRCEQYKEIQHFHKDRNARSGYRSWCDACESQKRRKTEPGPETPEGFKWCPGCEAVFPLDDFGLDSRRGDGHRGRCKPCYRERKKLKTRERREDPEFRERERIARLRRSADPAAIAKRAEQRALSKQAKRTLAKEVALQAIEGGVKCCKRCSKVKSLEDFQARKSSLDGRTSVCRECIRIRRNAPDPEDVEKVQSWKARKAAFDAAVEQRRASDPLVREIFEKG